MSLVFTSQEEFAEAVLAVVVTLGRTLVGHRNDVALTALLVSAGSSIEKFATQQPNTTPENVILLIALLKEVVGDIAEYAVVAPARES